MTKRWTGYAAAAISASLVLGGLTTTYGASVTLADFGADQGVKGIAFEAKAQKHVGSGETVEAASTENTSANKEENAAEGIDRSVVDTTGFAKAEDYINVRASGDTEGEIVGRLKLNDSVYIEDVDENGWYKVRSGNVEGYVAGYLIATGEEAEEVAKTAAYTYAQIGAEYLNIRSDASGDAEVLDTVGQGANLEVVEDLGDWVKVVTDDGIYGYVSREYVDTNTVYPTGEAVQGQTDGEGQEEQEGAQSQEAAYAAYLAEQEAAAAGQQADTEAAASTEGVSSDQAADTGAAEAAYTEYTEYTDNTSTEPSADTAYTDTGSAEAAYTEAAYTESTANTSYTDAAAQTTTSSGDVDALYQAYLTAQDAAMTATDEADAYAKANAAIEAYNAYLAACGSSQTVSAVDTTSADTGATDTTYTDQTYTDTGAADTTYTDQTSTDTGAADTTYTDQTSTDTGAADATYTDQTSTDTGAADATYTDQTYTDTSAADAAYTDAGTTDSTQAEASSSTGSGVGSQIASYASQFVGNPYVYGGTSLTNGADCSGFTMSVFSNFGIDLPHNAAAQSGCGTQVSLSDLQPGDLLFYGDSGIGHVAIYTGDGTVVHASNEETGIKTSAYNYRTPVSAVRCY